jgi:hypothetical protein
MGGRMTNPSRACATYDAIVEAACALGEFKA